MSLAWSCRPRTEYTNNILIADVGCYHFPKMKTFRLKYSSSRFTTFATAICIYLSHPLNKRMRHSITASPLKNSISHIFGLYRTRVSKATECIVPCISVHSLPTCSQTAESYKLRCCPNPLLNLYSFSDMESSLFKETTLYAKVLLAALLLGSLCLSNGQLRVGFYARTCPRAEDIVRSVVTEATKADSTVAPALLRLHNHDCFVRGCDASILIEGLNAEKKSNKHAGLRGFTVIERAKAQLESACPGVVSCADIVALAARDSVALSNGPNYDVPTGRRDGRVSIAQEADNMPDIGDSVDELKAKFVQKGLSEKDVVVLSGNSRKRRPVLSVKYFANSLLRYATNWGMKQNESPRIYYVANTHICCSSNKTLDDLMRISGAHTIGTTACFFMENRLYNFAGTGDSDPSINPDFLPELQSRCPKHGDVNVRLALDRGSEFAFDDNILRNIRNGFAVLESDAKLYTDESTRPVIDSYFGLLSGIFGPFFASDFADSMVRMGQIEVKTGSQGEIRRVCSRIN